MDILNYYKPMFHYLLDGFLGKNDPGAITNDVIHFLYDANIYNFNTKKTLQFINIDKINFGNLNNSILTLGLDSHATSLLFYIIGNDLFILSINSGLGIDKHKQYNKNNNILYSPFFCVKIEQYISTKRLNNDTNTESIKKEYNTDVLIKIINFSKLYQEIENYKFNQNANQTNEIINETNEIIIKISLITSTYM